MNRLEMQQRLDNIQEEAEQIKQALNKCFPTLEESVPGDELDGGWIVVEKYNGAALLAAPQDTIKELSWNNRNKVLEGLPGDCFIPSFGHLRLAYKTAKQHFTFKYHWASAESSSTDAYYVCFDYGSGSYDKECTFCVRAFRFVVF